MTKIAIVPMAAKPYHAGHDGLIRLAAKECNRVEVFVSTSDRKRPGEITVSGADMSDIWRTQIEPSMPSNVKINYVGNPVRSAWEFMGKANEEGSSDQFAVYSDPEDLAGNFPEKSLIKYTGTLYKKGQIILRPVQRTETVNVSGTKMRQFLAKGDKASFLKNLPQGIDGEVIWNRLSSRKSEGLLRMYVNESLRLL